MKAKDLSIVIPARNEMFLRETIDDILKNIEADTEVIALLDGQWADPPVPQHRRVNIIYVPESIGQRSGTNKAVQLSEAKYVMKVDAHCSFDKGFDRKMIGGFDKVGEDWVTMVPIMRNLWAFDWKCYHCGWKCYQGPTPPKCGWKRNKKKEWYDTGEGCNKSDNIRRKMLWVGKKAPQSKSYCFDPEPRFQYFNEYTKTDKYKAEKKTGFTETMSLQGSCFMATRENYWKYELCGDDLGSWGNQGIEVACKTWLSGGRVLVNHNTWYAHMFRTQGGDFGFPWPAVGTNKTKKKVKDLLWDQKWDEQIHPVSWLVERFWPVSGWTDEDLEELKEQEKSR